MFLQKSLVLKVLALSVVASVSPIVIHGNKFFNSSDGNQPFIKGVICQRNIKEGTVSDSFIGSRYIDSLADPALCLKDLAYLKQLGVNTIRVFQNDPTRSHHVCMNAFANSDIYFLADIREPEKSINGEDPHWDPCSPGILRKLNDYSIVEQRFLVPNPLGVHRSSNANFGKEIVNHPRVLLFWNALPVLPKLLLHETCEVHETNLLEEICLFTDCLEINGDGAKSKYKISSGCGIKEQISYALNKHWVQNDGNPAACKFESRAVLIPKKNGTTVDSIFTSDGRNRRDLIGKYLNPADVPREATALVEDKASVLNNGNNTFVQSTKKSGTVQATHWGLPVISSFMLSSIYLAT